MAKATKPPKAPRRVPSDDLIVVVDGEEYHPHAGEWVEFKGRPSVGLWLRMQTLTEGKGTEELLSLLLGHIAGWNWTDDDGNALENPPTLGTLSGLSMEEFGWLLGNLSTEGIPKN